MQTMIYPIYIYGSPVLRKQAENITPQYPELEQFVKDMFATMYHSNGIGLAAPQLGKSIRMFVIDLTQYADEDPTLESFVKVFINPEIYECSAEEVVMVEGCLSVPGLNEDVMRPESIRIRYMDHNFVEHDEEYDDFAARVIQHEYDHLDGKMFVDHLIPLRKSLLRSKLSGMSKGKYTASYKTKQL